MNCFLSFPGEPEVGKTSVFLKYTKNQFNYEYKPTRKVNIRKYMGIHLLFALMLILFCVYMC